MIAEDHKYILVGGWATPLKNMKVNWDDEIPNLSGKIVLMLTKPPTSIYIYNYCIHIMSSKNQPWAVEQPHVLMIRFKLTNFWKMVPAMFDVPKGKCILMPTDPTKIHSHKWNPIKMPWHVVKSLGRKQLESPLNNNKYNKIPWRSFSPMLYPLLYHHHIIFLCH